MRAYKAGSQLALEGAEVIADVRGHGAMQQPVPVEEVICGDGPPSATGPAINAWAGSSMLGMNACR
jgi:hypothetical protein